MGTKAFSLDLNCFYKYLLWWLCELTGQVQIFFETCIDIYPFRFIELHV